MRLLLDTNILIWGLNDPARIRPSVRRALAGHETWISHVSIWEIAVKQATGRPITELDMRSWLLGSGRNALPITLDHVWQVRDLPLLHRDPFDRLLVAQATIEDMTLVTSDRSLSAYGVATIQN